MAKGGTIALVDIGSGSVGAALARLSADDAPKLFGEVRISIPMSTTRDTSALMERIRHAATDAIAQVSTVAARMRAHEQAHEQGEVTRAALFFSPPWAALHLSGAAPDYAEPLRQNVQSSLASRFGYLPTTLYPMATPAVHGSVLLFPDAAPHILCIVGGDVTELLLVSPREVLGRGTIPAGLYTLLRTLVAHGEVSPEEANSFLRLAHQDAHPLREPLAAAGTHFADLFTDAARDLSGTHAPLGIIVMADGAHQELFAKTLTAHQPLSSLFPQGGVVRAMRAAHLMPYFSAHAAAPDLNLMLEALFVDAKFTHRGFDGI